MYLKRAIVYTRISQDRQSNWSIEGQRDAIQNWCDRNFVEVVDNFVDDGYTATNFDRPDYKRLNSFIEKHHKRVDHLVVFAFDRFSRDAGEALVAIKKLQRQFAIKIVSVAEGIVFDADDPASFFYAGLMLLKGEDEIIRNKVRINMGINTAKRLQGRFLGVAPFGYVNARDVNNKPIILPDPLTEPIVRYIFKAFLQNVQICDIYKEAKKMGLTLNGKVVIQRILQNRIYIGEIFARAYKDSPDEWVKGIHKPIIDRVTFYEVQSRFSAPKPCNRVSDDLPLRGVLKCHCGLPLTGAPSRGRHGNYFYYYKCKISGHNTIPAKKAHAELDEILENLSIPKETIDDVKVNAKKMTDIRLKDNKKLMDVTKSDLKEVDEKLKNIEEKFINNTIAQETYKRWFDEFSKNKHALMLRIEKLSKKKKDVYSSYKVEFESLSDLKAVYHNATTPLKQQLIRMGFDSRLYYQNGGYRTPYVLEFLDSNLLIDKDFQIKFRQKKRGNFSIPPSGGAEGVTVKNLLPILTYLESLKI